MTQGIQPSSVSSTGRLRLIRIAVELDIFARRIADPVTRPSAVEIAAGLQASALGIAQALEQAEDRLQTQEASIMAKWITRLSWVAKLRGWWTRVREFGR